MQNLRQAIKGQFGCTKSKLKMHDYRYVPTDHYRVEERCVKCYSRRD